MVRGQFVYAEARTMCVALMGAFGLAGNPSSFMSHYDISPHEADNRNHTRSPKKDAAVDPQLPRVNRPDQFTSISHIAAVATNRTCSSTAAEPYAT